MVLRNRDENNEYAETSEITLLNSKINHLRKIIEDALATEEKHYENDDTLPGWIMEAKEI